MKTLVILFIGLGAFVSCTPGEPGEGREINPNSVYFDYKISGEEEKGEVSVMLQYKLGDNNGANLMMEGSHVALDGEVLEADSAGLTGAYYEIRIPVEEFKGKHTITYTDAAGKEYIEEFEYTPFTLAATLPETLSRENLAIQLEGMKDEEALLIVLTDTSFHTNDINRIDTARKGLLKISREDLQEIRNGPVALEINKIEERPIKKGTMVGGRIIIEYGIRRVFEMSGR
jgi:hypothetical protein